MKYAFLKNATLEKLSNVRVWSKQVNDLNIVDVSLNAGPLLIPDRSGNGFSFEGFADAVEVLIVNLSRKFPFLVYEEKNKLHSTLITIFNDTPDQYEIAEVEVFSWCSRIKHLLHSISTITIKFDEIVLTSNGSLILTGHSYQLEQLREAVYDSLPIPDRLHKNIIHMTLGRLVEDRSSDEIGELVHYLTENGKVELPELAITSPNLVVSKGSFSSEMDTALTTHLNKSWV